MPNDLIREIEAAAILAIASACILEEIQRYQRDPERYATWARERGVMWGEDAEGWMASEAAGVLARRTRPPGTWTIIHPS